MLAEYLLCNCRDVLYNDVSHIDFPNQINESNDHELCSHRLVA